MLERVLFDGIVSFLFGKKQHPSAKTCKKKIDSPRNVALTTRQWERHDDDTNAGSDMGKIGKRQRVL